MGSDGRVEGGASPALSARQRRALGRIQLAGVIVITCLTLLAGMFRTWQVVAGSLAAVLVAVLVLGWFAAKVQRQPFRQLARDANRAVLDDFRARRTEWSHRLGRRD